MSYQIRSVVLSIMDVAPTHLVQVRKFDRRAHGGRYGRGTGEGARYGRGVLPFAGMTRIRFKG